jgi:hypothetical protein
LESFVPVESADSYISDLHPMLELLARLFTFQASFCEQTKS